MLTVFVLKLSTNKYYVRSTYNFLFTIKNIIKEKEHNTWLKKYKPFYIHKLVETDDDNYENILLLEYINKYGIDNVHGSTFDACVVEKYLLINRC